MKHKRKKSKGFNITLINAQLIQKLGVMKYLQKKLLPDLCLIGIFYSTAK